MMKPESVKHIIVHCSKTPKRMGDGLAVVERKCRMRGAFSCGYHYVISRDGTIQSSRELDEAGNHTLGYNDRSLGVCLVSMPGRVTYKQKRALQSLLSILKLQFPGAQPITHEELQPSTGRDCPGFKLKGT